MLLSFEHGTGTGTGTGTEFEFLYQVPRMLH